MGDINKNKEVVKDFISTVWNEGRIDQAPNYLSENFMDHSAMPGMPGGIEGFKMFFSAFKNAFPDIKIIIEDMVAERDEVCSRVLLSGTQTGEFMGMPASGKKISVGGVRTDRLANNKIAEHWAMFDQMGMMQQLGAIPKN